LPEIQSVPQTNDGPLGVKYVNLQGTII